MDDNAINNGFLDVESSKSLSDGNKDYLMGHQFTRANSEDIQIRKKPGG